MITALEQKAASSRKAREYTLSKNEKEIIAKMVEKYGDDYKVCQLKGQQFSMLMFYRKWCGIRKM